MFCLHICMCIVSTQMSAETRMSELELQVAMSCSLWILGTKSPVLDKSSECF